MLFSTKLDTRQSFSRNFEIPCSHQDGKIQTLTSIANKMNGSDPKTNEGGEYNVLSSV